MIDIAFVKSHARIVLDDDDALIQQYISAAYEALESYLDLTIVEDQAALDALPEVPDNYILENDSIKIAAAQGAAYLYEYRDMMPQYLSDVFAQTVSHIRRYGL